jgi:hypothetical protein
MAIAAVIVGVIVLGVLYWWVLTWDAVPKSWCVMFYLTSQIPKSSSPVSRPDSEIGLPAGATLDAKLDQVVQTIWKLPCASTAGISAEPSWDNVYVAYRAIWEDRDRDPEARVVRPELSAPSEKYFPGETIIDVGLSVDLTKDITKFFLWAYEKCPASHYAVFFWGHAMGPAGLFQQGQVPLVISPFLAILLRLLAWLTGENNWSGTIGLSAVSDALSAVVERRIQAGLENQEKAREGGQVSSTSPSSGSPVSPVLQIGEFVPKVDVVLFQDCWMSGLETLFELQDDARYIVASQSLVPIGFDPAGGLGAVWPYKDLISTFMSPGDFADPMMDVLKNFFNGVGLPAGTPSHYNRFPAKKVLFSLLDCTFSAGAVSESMQTEFLKLVEALRPLGKAGRSLLIDRAAQKAGRLYELSGLTLQVGDQALIDIVTLCNYLRTPAQWPNTLAVTPAQQSAITSAAQALQAKLEGSPPSQALIRRTFQSPDYVPGDLAYKGITALYKTFAIFGEDPFIENAYRSSYDRLRFSKETVTPPDAAGVKYSWTDYAFDRYPWF